MTITIDKSAISDLGLRILIARVYLYDPNSRADTKKKFFKEILEFASKAPQYWDLVAKLDYKVKTNQYLDFEKLDFCVSVLAPVMFGPKHMVIIKHDNVVCLTTWIDNTKFEVDSALLLYRPGQTKKDTNIPPAIHFLFAWLKTIHYHLFKNPDIFNSTGSLPPKHITEENIKTKVITKKQWLEESIKAPKIEVEKPYDLEGMTLPEFLDDKHIEIDKTIWVPLLPTMDDSDIEYIITAWTPSAYDLRQIPDIKKLVTKSEKTRRPFHENAISKVIDVLTKSENKGFLININFLIDPESEYLGRRVMTIYTETMDLAIKRIMEAVTKEQTKNG